MDPITAFQVAATGAQFLEIAIQVAKRMEQFRKNVVTLPDNLENIQTRLAVVIHTVELLQGQYNSSAQNGKNAEIFKFLKRTEGHCTAIMDILNKYLPKPSDSRLDRMKSGLKSIKRDRQIEELSDQLSEDAQFLSLLLGTETYQPASPGSASGPHAHLHKRTFYTVPARHVQEFFGQRHVLDRIENVLENRDALRQRVAVLCGMGGLGKTQLALEYCRRSRFKPYSWIFWIDATSRTSIDKAFVELAELLKAPTQTFQDRNSQSKHARLVLAECSQPWLMILDNYDNPHDYDVRDFVPDNERSCVLVTTRSQEVGRIGTTIELEDMEEADAVTLLFTGTGIERNDDRLVLARDIVRRLGCLPLAIDQVSAYIRKKQPMLPLEDFLSHYRQNKNDILASTPTVWEYVRESPSGRQHESVFTTWNMALQLLEPNSSSGRVKIALLDLLVYFDEKDISEGVLQAYGENCIHDGSVPWITEFLEDDGTWSTHKFGDYVCQLRDLSLISSLQRRAGDLHHVSIHPLVAD